MHFALPFIGANAGGLQSLHDVSYFILMLVYVTFQARTCFSELGICHRAYFACHAIIAEFACVHGSHLCLYLLPGCMFAIRIDFHQTEKSVKLHQRTFYTEFLLIFFLFSTQEGNVRIVRFGGQGPKGVGLGLCLSKIVLQGISARGCLGTVHLLHSGQNLL